MLDLTQLRSFVAVEQAGSFTAAAERLGLGQSTVSQHVQRLEASLGRRLLAYREIAGGTPAPRQLPVFP